MLELLERFVVAFEKIAKAMANHPTILFHGDESELNTAPGQVATVTEEKPDERQDEDPLPDIDTNGLPWDERIHSSNRKMTKDGVWQKRRGVTDAEVQKVTAELQGETTEELQEESSDEKEQVGEVEEPPEHESDVTVETIRDYLRRVKRETGDKDKALSILKEHGKAENVSSIEAVNYGAVLAACKEALGEA